MAALADGELEDGRAAGAQKNGAADFSDDGGGFAGLELVEGARVLTVFVSEGQVVEQVFSGKDGPGCRSSASLGPTPRTYMTGVSRPGTLWMLKHGGLALNRTAKGGEPALLLGGFPWIIQPLLLMADH